MGYIIEISIFSGFQEIFSKMFYKIMYVFFWKLELSDFWAFKIQYF